MILLPLKKYQESWQECTGRKWEEIKKRGREHSSLSFFIFNSEVPSIFASNGSHAHCFLPVTSLIQVLISPQCSAHIPDVSVAKLELGYVFIIFAWHAPLPLNVHSRFYHPSPKLSPTSQPSRAPSPNCCCTYITTCRKFNNLAQFKCVFTYSTDVISVFMGVISVSWAVLYASWERGGECFISEWSANYVVGDQEIFSDWLLREWGICSEFRLFLNP